MEEINRVFTYITANIDFLVHLLLEKGYEETGQCFHPTWGSKRKGKIFSRPTSPMFWIENDPSLNTVLVWIADDIPPYGLSIPCNCIIGHETLAIPKKSADGAVNCLKKLFGGEHIGVSFEPYLEDEEDREGWTRDKDVAGEMKISFF